MNEAVDNRTFLDKLGGNRGLVLQFSRKEFWKFIGFVLSTFKYGKKKHDILGKLTHLPLRRREVQ